MKKSALRESLSRDNGRPHTCWATRCLALVALPAPPPLVWPAIDHHGEFARRPRWLCTLRATAFPHDERRVALSEAPDGLGAPIGPLKGLRARRGLHVRMVREETRLVPGPIPYLPRRVGVNDDAVFLGVTDVRERGRLVGSRLRVHGRQVDRRDAVALRHGSLDSLDPHCAVAVHDACVFAEYLFGLLVEDRGS